MPWEDVSWIDLVNCSATPNLNDLTKTGGVDGNWDAGARSVKEIASAVEGAGAEFHLFPGSAVGLSADNPDAGFESIDFCIKKGWGDVYSTDVYENGVWKAEVVWTSRNRIIFNTSGQLEFWGYNEDFEEWALYYTSTTLPTFPLFVDTSMPNFRFPPNIQNVLINSVVVAVVDHLPLMGLH